MQICVCVGGVRWTAHALLVVGEWIVGFPKSAIGGSSTSAKRRGSNRRPEFGTADPEWVNQNQVSEPAGILFTNSMTSNPHPPSFRNDSKLKKSKNKIRCGGGFELALVPSLRVAVQRVHPGLRWVSGVIPAISRYRTSHFSRERRAKGLQSCFCPAVRLTEFGFQTTIK